MILRIYNYLLIRIYTFCHRLYFAHWGKGAHLGWTAMKLKGLKYISVGEGTYILPGIQLTAWDRHGKEQYSPNIIIGNHCTIRENSHITAIDSIIIGDNLLTGTNVLITDNSHRKSTMSLPYYKRPMYSKEPVVIDNNVWLSNNVCVMSGVTIDDGAIIGANSVVTHDIPSYFVADGIPAKVIKHLH